jgi:uncharacterized coiled-coil protein SlyX
MTDQTRANAAADSEVHEAADQRLSHLKLLLDDPSSPFATVFPGKISEDLLDPDFLCEAMHALQGIEKDELIADLKSQIADKDDTIADLMAELDANTKIFALRDKKIAELERKMKENGKDMLPKVAVRIAC